MGTKNENASSNIGYYKKKKNKETQWKKLQSMYA